MDHALGFSYTDMLLSDFFSFWNCFTSIIHMDRGLYKVLHRLLWWRLSSHINYKSSNRNVVICFGQHLASSSLLVTTLFYYVLAFMFTFYRTIYIIKIHSLSCIKLFLSIKKKIGLPLMPMVLLTFWPSLALVCLDLMFGLRILLMEDKLNQCIMYEK